MKYVLFLGVFLVVSVYSAKLPEYLKKCKKGTDNGDCVAQNVEAAINALIKNSGEPKFKLQGLKPIHVEKIDLQATPQLKVVLSDVNFHGFDNIKATGGGIDGQTLHIKAHLPRAEIVGKYDINGRILILPIQGQGTCNITMIDCDVDYKGKMVVEERKGKKYYQVTSDDKTSLKINNIKKVHWEFNNLFNGDERLGPEMNRFLNENALDVFKEVQGSMEETAAYSIVNQFVNGYLHFIPIEELMEE